MTLSEKIAVAVQDYAFEAKENPNGGDIQRAVLEIKLAFLESLPLPKKGDYDDAIIDIKKILLGIK